MTHLWSFVILYLVLFSDSYSDIVTNYEGIRIKKFLLSKCTQINYPVRVTNVKIEGAVMSNLTSALNINYSGSLSTDLDLTSPIKAFVSLKKFVWGMWIEVPCTNNLGSCTYNDLCKFGIPKDRACPEPFSANKVPCRCPIAQGNYTISPTLSLPKVESIYSGTYGGVIKIKNSKTILSCYNVHFQLYDGNSFDKESDLVDIS